MNDMMYHVILFSLESMITCDITRSPKASFHFYFIRRHKMQYIYIYVRASQPTSKGNHPNPPPAQKLAPSPPSTPPPLPLLRTKPPLILARKLIV